MGKGDEGACDVELGLRTYEGLEKDAVKAKDGSDGDAEAPVEVIEVSAFVLSFF